jgi:predicted amidohydrolase YtcJ
MHSDEIGVEAAEIGWAGSQEVSVIRWELFLEHVNPNTLAQMLKLESEAFAALGVTTFSSRLQFPKIMSGYAALADMEQMPIRFSAHYEVHRMPVDPDETRQLYRRTGVLQGIGDDYFWIDGVASERWDSHHPEGCTGKDIKGPTHLKERETCPKPGDLHWDTLSNAIRAGWRLKGIHSIGSEALRAFIRMLDNAVKNGWATEEQIRAGMPTVEHCDLIGKSPDIIAGLKKYNIMMSCGPDLLEFNTTWIMDYLPFNEAEHMRTFMMPYKTWIEQGVNIVGQHYGSGAFSSENRQPPFYIPWLTMSRMARGWIWAPEEKVDRVHALKMWTRWAARYVQREEEAGSLEEGKWADLVVLDRDYFTIPENDILKIRPLMTMVGGKVVALNSKLATEFKTEPVGYQFDFKDEEIQWIYDELKASKPWNGEIIPPGKG